MEPKATNALTSFLLPVDGSENSLRALHFAGCLAAGLGDRVRNITLLHVLAGHYLSEHMANVDFRTKEILESGLFRRLKEQYIETTVAPILDAAEAAIREMGAKTPVARQILDGNPAEKTAKMAEEGGFSTIILARRGVSRAREVLLGSVTSTLLHLPYHPTTYVVGRKVLKDGACLVPKILVPLDGSRSSLAALREAAVIARSSGACLERVELLRVIDLARYPERVAGGERPEEEAGRILAEGETVLDEEGLPRGCVKTNVVYGRPVEAILDAAREKDATLIMMGRLGRSAVRDIVIGGVSSEVVHRAVEPTVAVVCADGK